MDDSAVASVYQFAVGGAILVLFIATVLQATTSMGADSSSGDAALSEARAAALSDVALSGGWAWSEGGTSVPTGFQAGDGSFDLSVIGHLKSAGLDPAPDGRLGYEEARHVWGAGGDGFHLRVRPISTTGLYDFSELRVAYIGAWSDVTELHVSLGTDQQMVAGLRAQVDLAMGEAAAQERQILASLGIDYDNHVHLTAAGPALLVDTVVPAGGRVFLCHGGVTIEVAASSVAFHLLHGDSLGACPGDTPSGRVVSVPLLNVLGDITLLEGDVYYDDVDYLASAVAGRLSRYDVVVVGSQAAPQALGQGGLPAGLRQHVEGGGLLVVFGGTADDAWIASTTDAIMTTGNQEASTPDLQHPLLTWPLLVDHEALQVGHPLDAGAFPDLAWQHVLRGQSDHLLLSPLGAYGGSGLVVATSFEPTDEPGLALATNIFGYYSRQDLHLDFGPRVPEATIAAAVSTRWATDLGGNQVALRAELRYWLV